MIRLALNFVITTVLLFVFNWLNWLTLNHEGVRADWQHLTGPVIGSVLLIAVVFWVIGGITGLLFGISVLLTFGLALVLYPLIGWAVLATTAHFMPGTLTIHGFWITLLCGWLLMIVKCPVPKKADA